MSKVESKWLDMASAPQDRTRILLTDGELVYVAAWLDDNEGLRYRPKRMEWAITESWQDEQGGYQTITNPLGWMPCPDPKTAELNKPTK